MVPPQGKKKSLGRRKIEMKLIADENARTVTFSKRRAGLFKKATELSVLCGTLIIFSLGGRAYSFGHPDVESIIARFFNIPLPMRPESSSQARPLGAAMVKGQLDQKSAELETKKKRGKEIEAALQNSFYQISEERLDRLNLHQLQQLKQKMETLRDKMHRLINTPKESIAAGPDLTEVGRKESGASPIPPDWLKL